MYYMTEGDSKRILMSMKTKEEAARMFYTAISLLLWNEKRTAHETKRTEIEQVEYVLKTYRLTDGSGKVLDPASM